MAYRHTDQATDTRRLIDIPPTDLRLRPNPDVDYQDRFRGAMVATATGDALGRALEGMSPYRIRRQHGYVTELIAWGGYVSGPKGTLTDDTEMTLCLAQSIIEKGVVDPHDVAERFMYWGLIGRGMGSATRAACGRIAKGSPWYEAGSASAGNGAAMRSTPIALAAPFNIDTLRRIAAQTTVITHADPTAVASSIVMAYVTSFLLHTQAGGLDLDELLAGIDNVLNGIEDPPVKQRKPGRWVTLRDRIHEVFLMRHMHVEDIYDVTHNGAFVLESLPAAIGAFIVNHNDPERTITDAANGGYDADTVAAMAGSFAGAYHGLSNLPIRWTDDLEFLDGLVGAADELASLAGFDVEPPTSDGR
ncbi:MAG: ADP-ribosylglycohydrolase family protein, partial [Actinomycetia bacterium]|nr:ADP-ribosylglycohydrolase family protein [Actinomycetes bacterium]